MFPYYQPVITLIAFYLGAGFRANLAIDNTYIIAFGEQC